MVPSTPSPAPSTPKPGFKAVSFMVRVGKKKVNALKTRILGGGR